MLKDEHILQVTQTTSQDTCPDIGSIMQCPRTLNYFSVQLAKSAASGCTSLLGFVGHAQLALLEFHQGLDQLRCTDASAKLHDILLRQSTIRALLNPADVVIQHGHCNEVYAHSRGGCALTRCMPFCTTGRTLYLCQNMLAWSRLLRDNNTL